MGAGGGFSVFVGEFFFEDLFVKLVLGLAHVAADDMADLGDDVFANVGLAAAQDGGSE